VRIREPAALCKNMDEIITKENVNRFLCLQLDVAEGLLCSGADIHKIEENFRKIGKTYGVKELSAFIIPTLITANVQLEGDFGLSLSRRVPIENITTNLRQLSRLNEITHICRHRAMPLDELQRRLEEAKQPIKTSTFYLGSALIAFSFALFFGGSLWDAAASVLLAFAICFIQRVVSKLIPNRFAQSFLCALIIGVAAELMGRMFGGLQPDKILIGDIMLLIPGITVTFSVRDIIVGDTGSGTIRLIDGLFVTGAMAFGFWLAHLLVGG